MTAVPAEYVKLFTSLQSILVSSKCDKHPNLLHVARVQLEPFVFEILQNRYGATFTRHWDTTVIPKDADKALVIVERRCHPYLPFVIKNAVYFNPGHTLHIFCSKANRAYVEHVCGTQVSNVHIHPIWEGIGTPEEGKVDYNVLLRQRSFYEMLREEHLLIFETDCYFLRTPPPSMTTYDYVAAKWGWQPDAPGGGGLSYRKRSVMLDICDRYFNETTVMQDCFASEGVQKLGYSFPSLEENAVYFTESVPSTYPAGTHQWWTFLTHFPNDFVKIAHIYLTLDM
jgi:hypothetical protein